MMSTKQTDVPCKMKPLGILICVVVSFFLANVNSAALGDELRRKPFSAGPYPQLVRDFYSSELGLPDDNVRSVTVTRSGVVIAACETGLTRLESDHWKPEVGPTNVTTLFAPSAGPEALAGTAAGVWALANGKWGRDAGAPERVITFSAEPDGTPWALAPSGVWRRSDGWKRVHIVEDDLMFDVRDVLPRGPEDALIASRTGLFGMRGKRKYWLPYEFRQGGLISTDTRAVKRFDGDHFLVLTDKGLNLSNGTRGWYAFTGKEGLPILDLTHAAVAGDGSVWLGSNQGLIHWMGTRWSYLEGKRWLPNDRVTSLALAGDGSVWVGTPSGLAHLYDRKLSLEQKAAHYQTIADGRKRRHGFMGELYLARPGVVEGALQEISDNDGLRTGMYSAAEAFRYAATKSPEAKDQAWRAMQALLRLETITGISGFPARAMCHVDEPQFNHRSLRSDSEWHESPIEKGWYWKGETSSDEIDGHYFGWYVFYELAADDKEKEAVRPVVKRVTDHLLNNNYSLIDIDGKPTTWGFWGPDKLNDHPMWFSERGINSLEMLSHLKVAHHIVGDPRYESAYNDLIRQHHYAINTLEAKLPGGVSHDDQLMFLAYYPLLQLEKDPARRTLFKSSLNRTWQLERVEANPLWNFIYGASTSEPFDAEAAVETLREIPLDLIDWRVRNSHRADLKFNPELERQGIKQLAKPLPYTERPFHKWDHSPFELDGGNDHAEADPTIWLLPYWMGRHHQLID